VQRDVSDLQAKVTGQTLGLSLKPETYQRLLRDGLPFELRVETGPRMGAARVVVVDVNSGRMGSVTLPAIALTAKQ
jgi:hypothetical protein